jgi:hypothetical protein
MATAVFAAAAMIMRRSPPECQLSRRAAVVAATVSGAAGA